MALAGMLAAQKVVGKAITEHKVLFLGAGEVSSAMVSSAIQVKPHRTVKKGVLCVLLQNFV